MAMERSAKSDVQLSEQVSHVDLLPKGKEYMEVNGLIVRGEADGMEICLESMCWHFGGGRNGQWRVDEAVVAQTNFHMVPKGLGTMVDNEFTCNRVDPTDWVGSLEVVQEPDRVIWKAANLQWINRPPYWQLQGEHMGIEFDITLGALGNPTWVYGPWENLAEKGRAGYDQRTWAEGTVTVKGKKYTIENGWGDHGLLIFDEKYQAVEGQRAGYYWVWAWHEKIQTFFWVQPGSGIGHGYAYTEDGREFILKPGEVRVTALDRWTDPVTNLDMPVRWHVSMKTQGLSAEYVLDGCGRGIFAVPSRDGLTARYSFSARGNGRAFLDTGESVALQDMTSYVEWGKSVLPLPSGVPDVG